LGQADVRVSALSERKKIEKQSQSICFEANSGVWGTVLKYCGDWHGRESSSEAIKEKAR
jgi:hypothetical protein